MRRLFFFVCGVPFVFSVFIAAALFSACGIDDYIYLYPVNTYLNLPDTADDESRNYWAFRTNDVRNDSAASGYFRGYELYYRIYDNLATLQSERKAIDSYNEDDSTSAMAFSHLTSRYNYKRMTAANRMSDYPLIPAADFNRDVYIRIYDTVDGNITAGIKIYANGEGSALLLDLGQARRTIGGISQNANAYRFDDFDYILTTNDDVRRSSGTFQEPLYVQLYVVAYGYDESFQSLYSTLFSLGYIGLRETWER